MSDERCEPPEELRGVDGVWYWVKSQHGDAPVAAMWSAPRQVWAVLSDTTRTPEEMRSSGYAAVCPIPTPSALAAAKEREAALVEMLVSFSGELTDEGGGCWSNEGLHRLRCEAARLLPDDRLPDWLIPYRRTTP